MSCGVINPGNLYLWLSLGGLLAGGGLSFIAAPAKRRKFTVAAVLFSLAIITTLASFAVADFDFSNLQFRLYWFIAGLIVGYTGLLLWKIIGIPVFFLLFVFASASWYSFYFWSCANPGTEICSFNTLSTGKDFVRIQYTVPGEEPDIVLVQGKEIYPSLQFIEVPDYFFLAGSKKAYRFNGFSDSPSGNTIEDVGTIMSILHKLPGFSYYPNAMEQIEFSPSLENKIVINFLYEPELIRVIE